MSENHDPNLTPAEKDRMLLELHHAVCGNPFNPEDEPGILKLQLEMRDEIYGCKEKRTQGMKFKVETMWEDRLKIMAACAAVTGIILVLAKIFFFKG